MKRTLCGLLTVSSFLLVTLSAASAQQNMMLTDKQLLDEMQDAAPADVVKNAAIMNMGADGKMTTVQTGTNGWTCMDPGGGPMCADAGAMEWAKARKNKGPAPQSLGFIYMLRGDNGASNTDPFATGETPDNNWIKTGSHVMIVGAEGKSMMQGYPRDEKANPTKPYVMWPDAPFEHLMLPVK